MCFRGSGVVSRAFYWVSGGFQFKGILGRNQGVSDEFMKIFKGYSICIFKGLSRGLT